MQAILTEFFIEYPILAVPDAITDPQSVVVTVLDNVILTKLVCYHNSVPNIYAPYYESRLAAMELEGRYSVKGHKIKGQGSGKK